MNSTVKYVLPLLCLVTLLQSCDSDDDAVKQYGTGTLVANEGGNNTGSVTFYDPAGQTASQNIFKNAAGEFAGDILQSITLHGDEAYLVLNRSSAIEVASAKTFQSLRKLTAPALNQPRYVEIINGKAYISVWGPFDENYALVDSYVLVMDPETMAVLDTVDTDEGVENLLYNGDLLFAANYNYGGSSTVAVIDPADNSLVDQVELAAGPAGMALDANDKLWVITTGTYAGNDGKLFRLHPVTLEVEDEIELNVNPGMDLYATPDGQHLLYHHANKIYKMSIDATTAPTTAFIDAEDVQNAYALGVHPGNGDIYIGDALNFATVGTVYIYAADGTFKQSFEAGISPGQFIFK